MSAPSQSGSAALTLSLERQVNDVCDRFEAAWQAGARPRLEDYLADCPEPARPALLAELLPLELAYLRGAGEAPAAAEYRARFPGHDALIDGAFRSLTHSTVCVPPLPEGSAGLPRGRPGGAAAGPPEVPGHEILGELGRGGMGVVWRGRDCRLQRELAVKVLRAEMTGQPRLIRRFIEEAQVASQLQHPAIPPVHALGELADGRPYFAMKLVKGRTLADLLEARAGPADDRPRLLGIFEQACQAVAYAHSKGVIHRDLKPRNVMVGAFGEVQVMDWGLAKVLKQEPPGETVADPGESVVETVRTAEADDATQAGLVLGTYAYMAPEQARGEIARLDRRADVFGLGAILCEVLTGQPPYAGTAEEVKAQARVGHLAVARERLAACGAEAELVELAKRSLSAEPEERPADAAAVAAALTAYLAGVQERLRRAELERAAAEARAEAEGQARAAAQAKVRAERRARRLTAGLAAAVLALMLLGAASLLWRERQREGIGRAASGAMGQAEQSAAEARALSRDRLADVQKAVALWEQALAALDRADERAADAALAERCAALRREMEAEADEARRRRDQLASEARLLGDLEQARMAAGTWVGSGFDQFRVALRDGYEAALRDYGIDVRAGDVPILVERLRRLPASVFEPTVFALEHWALHTDDKSLRERLQQAAQEMDDDDWRRRWRAARAQPGIEPLRQLAEEARRRPIPALGFGLLSEDLRQRRFSGDSITLLRHGQRVHPTDFWIHWDLGKMLHYTTVRNPVWLEEAIGCYRTALALRPQTSLLYCDLGNALTRKDRPDREGAIAAYRRASDIDPNSRLAHVNLGILLRATWDLPGAIAAFRRAIAIGPENAKAAAIHHMLGGALRESGDPLGAAAEFRKAIAIDPNLVNSYLALANLLQRQGQFSAALETLQQAHDLGSLRPDQRSVIVRSIEEVKRLQALEARLPTFLKGDAKPASAAEALALADVCLFTKRYAASARFFAAAFAADPKRAESFVYCSIAAPAAALAAAGRGDDAADLPDRERAQLRQQALDWLRAALTDAGKRAGQVNSRPEIREHLRTWQNTPSFAEVREEKELEKLPPAEREAWRQFWADVAALWHKVEE
jgi:serine/threonine-protein kinase